MYLLETTLRKLEQTSVAHAANRLCQNKDYPHIIYGPILLASARKENNTILFFKINFIEQVESGIPSINDAFNNKIDKSLVSRWIQNKKKLLMALRLNTKNSLRKTENGAKMKGNLRNKLYQKFKEARSEGLKVSFSRLYTKLNALSKTLTQNLKRLSKAAVVMFSSKV